MTLTRGPLDEIAALGDASSPLVSLLALVERHDGLTDAEWESAGDAVAEHLPDGRKLRTAAE